MSGAVVILATLDTKSEEAAYLRSEIESLGGTAIVVDLGVVGEPATPADVGREEVAAAGGVELATLLQNPTREEAAPVMVAGATRIVLESIRDGRAQAVLGVGGTQGTSSSRVRPAAWAAWRSRCWRSAATVSWPRRAAQTKPRICRVSVPPR